MNTAPRLCYCQNCKSANPLGEDSCLACGTRLMLVVEPPGSRFDQGAFVTLGEENLFERVTLLELRLGQVLEKVGKTLDLLLQQSRNQQFDHTLLETVVEALAAGGVVSGTDLRVAWQRKRKREAGESAEAQRRDRLRTEATKYFTGKDQLGFSATIERGLDHFASGHYRKGLNVLERLAATESKNVALNLFLGEHFFAQRKMTLARSYLSLAYKPAPEDARIGLLYGLSLAAEGELRRADEILRHAFRLGAERVPVRLGMGWVAVAERNWEGAHSAFRNVATGRRYVEIIHLQAAVCYQLERYRLAEKHVARYLNQAPQTVSIMELLGAIKSQMKNYEAAREAYAAARQMFVKGKDRLCVAKASTFPREPALAPIFQQFARTRKCLIISSETELGALMRNEALKLPVSAN